MDKDFQWHIKAFLECLFFNGIDFIERALTCEYHDAGTKLFGEMHAGFTGHTHLSGGMDWEVRGEFADQLANADILHNRSIHP